MELHEQLDQWRAKHGLTQKDAAAQLGVSVRTLENWNQGRYIPKGFALKSLLEKITAPNNHVSTSVVRDRGSVEG